MEVLPVAAPRSPGYERTSSPLRSRPEFSRFLVDSTPEAIATLVRAADFKSVGGCGDTTSAGSIPVRFRHTDFEDTPLPSLARSPQRSLEDLRRRPLKSAILSAEPPPHCGLAPVRASRELLPERPPRD